MPAGVVTVMSTVPVLAGDVAVIEVELLTVNEVALALPNLTAVAPVKLVPVILTRTLGPPAGAVDGAIEVTVGASNGGSLAFGYQKSANPANNRFRNRWRDLHLHCSRGDRIRTCDFVVPNHAL